MIKNNHIFNVNKPINKEYSVIIPAAGLGTRMKSFGPKALIEVNEEPILHKQIKIIRKALKKCEIIVVGGFQIEKIHKFATTNRHKLKILENKEYESNNVLKSIDIGLKEAKYTDVIIVYSDLVFNSNTFVAPFGLQSMALIDQTGFMGKNEVGCVLSNHIIQSMMYTLPNKWAQIVYLTNRELEIMKNICASGQLDHAFGFEALNLMIDQGGILYGYTPRKMKIMDIDCSRDLIKASTI